MKVSQERESGSITRPFYFPAEREVLLAASFPVISYSAEVYFAFLYLL